MKSLIQRLLFGRPATGTRVDLRPGKLRTLRTHEPIDRADFNGVYSIVSRELAKSRETDREAGVWVR